MKYGYLIICVMVVASFLTLPVVSGLWINRLDFGLFSGDAKKLLRVGAHIVLVLFFFALSYIVYDMTALLMRLTDMMR